MSENSILERILSDAQAEADAMLCDADKKAQAALKNAMAQIERENAERLAAVKKQRVNELEQFKLESDNETAKRILVGKQQIVGKVFESVKADLLKMDEAAKQRLANALVKKFSKKGDAVTVLKQGGVTLSNAHYDLDLSLDALLSSLREQLEQEVAEILFK